MNHRFVYCYYGNGIALGMYGQRETIQQFFNFLFNHNGTKSEPIEVSETFSYILTTWDRLERGLQNGLISQSLWDIRHEPRVSPNPALWLDARVKAAAFIQNLTPEEFLTHQEAYGQDYRFPTTPAQETT